MFSRYPLTQELAAYGPLAQSGLPPDFVSTVLLEYNHVIHINTIVYSYFCTTMAKVSIVVETIWPAMLKLFIVWLFNKKKFANFYTTRFNSIYSLIIFIRFSLFLYFFFAKYFDTKNKYWILLNPLPALR